MDDRSIGENIDVFRLFSDRLLDLLDSTSEQFRSFSQRSIFHLRFRQRRVAKERLGSTGRLGNDERILGQRGRASFRSGRQTVGQLRSFSRRRTGTSACLSSETLRRNPGASTTADVSSSRSQFTCIDNRPDLISCSTHRTGQNFPMKNALPFFFFFFLFLQQFVETHFQEVSLSSLSKTKERNQSITLTCN